MWSPVVALDGAGRRAASDYTKVGLVEYFRNHLVKDLSRCLRARSSQRKNLLYVIHNRVE